MELQLLTDDNLNQYNNFVAAHPSGSFLQSWAWGQWQEQLGHKTHRFFIKDAEQIFLSAQIIETKIPRFNKTYLYIPYGPLLQSGGSKKVVIEFFLDQLKQKFPHSLFIRLEPKEELGINGKPTTHIQPGKTSVVDLAQSIDQLLARMHPKTRYNIKVAQKHGVRIITEPIITPRHGLYLKEVVDLLTQTAQRQGFKSHAAAYYQKLIDFSGLQLTVYRAVLNNQLLASAVMIDFGPTRTYLFGGTSGEQKNVMTPYALHWQAIQDAQTKGLKSYDFWGVETAGGKTPGFVRFKLGWGGQNLDYPAAIDIVQRPTWYTIYKLFRFLNRKIS